MKVRVSESFLKSDLARERYWEERGRGNDLDDSSSPSANQDTNISMQSASLRVTNDMSAAEDTCVISNLSFIQWNVMREGGDIVTSERSSSHHPSRVS
jgi:hypothetical protein